MPVLAIGGAIMAGVSAAGAIGGLLTTGALTVMGALEITAAVGATIGAIGSITGDKDLAMAGLVLGGIGGVGSLAVGAGLFGDDLAGAMLFGGSNTAATTTAAGGVAPVVDAGMAARPALDVTVSNLPQIGQEGLVAASGNVGADLALPTTALGQQTGAAAGFAGDLVANPAAIGAPSAGASVAAEAAKTATLDAATGAWLPGAEGFPAGVVTEAAGAPSGFFGKIGSFAKNNPLVTYGVVQAGGALVGGLFDPMAPAQVDALDAQAEANRAAAKLAEMRNRNMASPIPKAQRVSAANVTGVPAGLINAPTTSGVTGVPA